MCAACQHDVPVTTSAGCPSGCFVALLSAPACMDAKDCPVCHATLPAGMLELASLSPLSILLTGTTPVNTSTGLTVLPRCVPTWRKPPVQENMSVGVALSDACHSES